MRLHWAEVVAQCTSLLECAAIPSLSMTSSTQPGKPKSPFLRLRIPRGFKGRNWLSAEILGAEGANGESAINTADRHPAWATTGAHFPTAYDASNPPYILIFKIGNSFHARFALESQLLKLTSAERPRGIISTPLRESWNISPTAFAAAFRVPGLTRFEEFEIQQNDEPGGGVRSREHVSDGRRQNYSGGHSTTGSTGVPPKIDIRVCRSLRHGTQCKSLWVLEAAHITPYRGLKTNSVSNGLLLRADVHTLFDLALISIEPSNFVVRVSKLLGESEYEDLMADQPTLPSKTALHPSIAALPNTVTLFRLFASLTVARSGNHTNTRARKR